MSTVLVIALINLTFWPPLVGLAGSLRRIAEAIEKQNAHYGIAEKEEA